MHSLSSLTCVVLLMVMLTADIEGSALRTGTLPEEFNVEMHHLTTYGKLEMAFFIIYLGKIVEEGTQLYRSGSGYFSSLWNYMDFLHVMLFLSAMVCRACVYVNSAVTGQYGISLGGKWDNEVVILSQAHTLMVVGMVVLILRLFEVLTFFPSIGVMWVVLLEMIHEATPVFMMMLMTAVAIGLAMTAFLPAAKGMTMTFAKPWAFGLWGIVGYFEPVDWYASLAAFNGTASESTLANVERYNWMPLLLFLFIYFNSIFLVNLMIAKITSTFARIEATSRAYRAQQELQLVLNFKDEVGPAPPVNLLFLIARALAQLGRCLCRWVRVDLSAHRGPEVCKGFAARMDRATSLRQVNMEAALLRHYLAKLSAK